MSIFVQLPLKDYDRAAFAAFLPQRGRFDLDDARAMMWLSQLAYETDAPATIKTIGPLWGFDPIPSLRAQGLAIDTRAIVGMRNDCTVVAFAGTDPALAANLLTDANVRLTPANTHKGFQDALDAVWPRIEPLIRTSPRPLFFTGHSLGAALAALAAKKAFDSDMTPAAVYTFGMPRAGGPTFAAAYNASLGDRTFRLVHGADTVPCVPDAILDALPVQFRHVGHMLKCDSGAKFDKVAQLMDIQANEPRFVAGMRENLRNRLSAAMAGQLLAPTGPGMLGPLLALLPFAIRDHLPDRYRHALEA